MQDVVVFFSSNNLVQLQNHHNSNLVAQLLNLFAVIVKTWYAGEFKGGRGKAAPSFSSFLVH